MKSLVKNIPIPIVGLMLALAAAGNLIQSYGEIYRIILGIISALILLLVTIKIITYPSLVKEELKNPLVASVFPALTMGIMLLSTYSKAFAPKLSFGIWIFGLIGHAILILQFSLNHLLNFDLKKVFPSWFIVYVGIVVGSVTAPIFQMQTLGKFLFWIGIFSYILILPIVLKRIRIENIAEAALPSLAIFTAPLALCLAGYLNSFANKSMLIVWLLLIFSQFNYIFVLSQLPKLLKIKFYPSFSALTFPLVISAISIKLTRGYLIEKGQSIFFLKYIVIAEEVLAITIVIYVLIKYINFLIKSTASENIKEPSLPPRQS